MGDRSNYKAKTAAFGILCVVVYFLLISLMPEVKAFMLAMALGVLYIVGSERWRFRNRVWFWSVLGLLGIFHLAIILPLRAPHLDGPSLIIFPAMLLDCWLGLFAIDRFARRQDRYANNTAASK